MYFQILDNRRECVGLFFNNELHYDGILTNPLTHTWSYHPNFESAEVGNLYVKGAPIADIAPAQYQDAWAKVNQKKQAFINSFRSAKIDLNQHCFFDLVPESFLLEYNYFKNEITKFVFENVPKPENYEHLKKLAHFVDKLAAQPLQLDPKEYLYLRATQKVSYSPYIKYNMFGTITGRFTTDSFSFPILTLNKKHRTIVQCRNNLFLEMDVNAAEIRTFLALLGEDQPEGDIHEWNMTHVFKGCDSRDEAKTRFFSWFYNPNNVDKELQKLYKRDYLLDQYYADGWVTNPFGRKIKSDDFHALNYLIQSASNDIVLQNILKLDQLLEGRKSFISFGVHDSVVVDWHEDDYDLLPEMKSAFAKTEYGRFGISAQTGKNFGELNTNV